VIKNQKMKTINQLSVCLISIKNNKKPYQMNKDLNGGLGTYDYFGDSWSSKLLQVARKQMTVIPIISFGYIQAILLDIGVRSVDLYEVTIPKKGVKDYDLILIAGSIVDYRYENIICLELKKEYPRAKVGYFGSFPTVLPRIFQNGDFVIIGEVESYFMNQFNALEHLNGFVVVDKLTDVNRLPSPNLSNIMIDNYSYQPGLNSKPFYTLISSRGCPYSCKYYCTYGEYQGATIRQRTPEKVVNDMLVLHDEYGVKAIQFRDPTFGIQGGFIKKLCELLIIKNVDIEWGIETRLDLLNKSTIKDMYEAGLRLINVGIETNNESIARMNKRKIVEKNHQEEIISYCHKIGIKVTGFFIICLDHDDEISIKNTIKYALSLKLYLARFSISTPYPGTDYFDRLNKENRLITHDYEKYTQFNLVYNNPNITPQKARIMLEYAYRQFYFRTGFIVNYILWKIRDILKT
jgi:anaerobic magnesium-protoporphyrin IX monomethyl ester cyclase